MAWLLDTNVVSELRKGARAQVAVREWAASIATDRQAISVLTLGEIRKGIEKIRFRDPVQAVVLDEWLSDLKRIYASEILPVGAEISEEWGRMNVERSLPVIDGLLAATARVHGLKIATQNVVDFEGVGLQVHNPFHG